MRKWPAISFASVVLNVATIAITTVSAQEGAGAPPKRFALLIGIKDYRPNDYVPSSDKPVMFENLKTSCNDIDKISTQLQKLGWRGPEDDDPEIETICDASVGDIFPKIGRRVERFDKPDHFLLLYIAGHGVEVNDRNYIFTRRAELDLKLAGQRLRNNPENILFQGDSMELNQDLFARAGASYRGNILIVLDSCRNDPFVYTAMSSQFLIKVSAPQINNRSNGIMVLYATTPGKRISDGVGSSFIAESLASEMAKGAKGWSIDKVVTNTINAVTRDTKFTPFPQWPDRVGGLNNPDICFSGCSWFDRNSASATAAQVLSRKAVFPKNPLVRVGYLVDMYDSSASRTTSERMDSHKSPRSRAFKTIYKAPNATRVRSSGALTLDFFWCEGETQLGRERDSTALAENIARTVREGTGGPGSPIARIRVRSLGSEENARPGYRISKNVIRIDSGSTREEEWAKKIKKASSAALHLETIRARSLDSVSIFFCEGVPSFARLSRLWLQAAREDQKGIATLLGQSISEEIDDIWVADAVEVVRSSPDKTQIRYFYKADEVLARKIADVIAFRRGSRPGVHYLPGYADRVERGLIELWVGQFAKVGPAGTRLH